MTAVEYPGEFINSANLIITSAPSNRLTIEPSGNQSCAKSATTTIGRKRLPSG